MSFLIRNLMNKVLSPSVIKLKQQNNLFHKGIPSLVRVQDRAPDFKATAVHNGEFQELKLADYKGKYVVLLFYPLDFTFVCPTELISFSEKANDFASIGCQVIGVSTDSEYSHLAWTQTARKDGGVGKLEFPLLADFNKKMARDYDVLLENQGIALRGLFVIDGNQILRHMSVNDLPVGRSAAETLRLVKAFQYADKHGEVCPANWNPESNAATIKPNPKGSKEYFQKANA